MARKRVGNWRSKIKKATGKPKTGKSWMAMLGDETREHIAIVEELEIYPWLKDKVWWHYPAEGKKSKFEAWLFKVMGGKKSIPDFMFIEPRNGYSGLAIEYKKTGCKIFKPDGSLYAGAHMKAQYDMLLKLEERGYKIHILEGVENFINAVKDYFNIPYEND